MHITEGERYEEGEMLLTLDSPELDIERSIRILDRDIAAAQRRQLAIGARTEDIREAQARVRRAERDRQQASDDYDRMARLLESGSIPRSQYESAEVALTRAEAEYETATQTLERIENLTRPEEFEIASLRSDQASLAVDRAELNAARREIRIPRSAWLDTVLVETGELVQPGQPVARLIDRDLLTLTVYISQQDLGKVSVGDPAEVRVDAWPEERFDGTVRRIAEEAEFTPGNIQTRDDRARLVFAVEVAIPNSSLRLRPGMGAEAEFPGSERSVSTEGRDD
ncbi:HlyD family secretion protein [Spirochaeta africana]|uniref:HlyD family secretion protein n=1 Tax=Spirochaeta africana TaxID=46355 RepID=UPI00145CA333|nr:HlyD family efflux transporter periplasmic adaptor subunit [Spirochaeta africana]